MLLLQKKEEGAQGLVQWGSFPGHGFVPHFSREERECKEGSISGAGSMEQTAIRGIQPNLRFPFHSRRPGHDLNPDDRGAPGPVFGGTGRFLFSFKIRQAENAISLVF